MDHYPFDFSVDQFLDSASDPRLAASQIVEMRMNQRSNRAKTRYADPDDAENA